MVTKRKSKQSARKRGRAGYDDSFLSTDTDDILSPFSDESTLSEFTSFTPDYSSLKSDQYSILRSDFSVSASNDLSFLNSREFTSTKSPEFTELWKKKLKEKIDKKYEICNDEDEKKKTKENKFWIKNKKRCTPMKMSCSCRVSHDEFRNELKQLPETSDLPQEKCECTISRTKNKKTWTPDRQSIVETCNELKNLTQTCESTTKQREFHDKKMKDSKTRNTKCQSSMCENEKKIVPFADTTEKEEKDKLGNAKWKNPSKYQQTSKEEKLSDKYRKKKFRKKKTDDKKAKKSSICQNICSRLRKLTDTSNDEMVEKAVKPSYRKYKKEKKKKKEPSTLTKIVGESYRVLRKLSGFGLCDKVETTNKIVPKKKSKATDRSIRSRKLSDSCITWVNESTDKQYKQCKNQRLSDSRINEGFCFARHRSDWRRGNEFLKHKLGKYCCRNSDCCKKGKCSEKTKCKKIENICKKKCKSINHQLLSDLNEGSCESIESEQLRSKIALLQDIIKRRELKKRNNGDNPRIKILRKLGKGDLTSTIASSKEQFGCSLVPYKKALIESTF